MFWLVFVHILFQTSALALVCLRNRAAELCLCYANYDMILGTLTVRCVCAIFQFVIRCVNVYNLHNAFQHYIMHLVSTQCWVFCLQNFTESIFDYALNAMGTINKPADVDLGNILPDLKSKCSENSGRVWEFCIVERVALLQLYSLIKQSMIC